MITLFIDTSFSDVSIALLKNNKIVSKKIENIPNEHSKYAILYIEEVLKKANVEANQVNNIMVVNGPGSFTGIRIGLTIAKIYAYLLNISVTLVSSLKALALSCDDQLTLALIDAKNDNYYLALYDEDYNELIKEHFSNIEEVNQICKDYKNVKIVTNSNINNYLKIQNLNIEKIVKYYQNNEKVNAHQVLPNYLKLPQALEKK